MGNARRTIPLAATRLFALPGGGTGLAVRAEPGGTPLDAVALPRDPDRAAAADTAHPGPLVDPIATATRQLAGGALLVSPGVGEQQFPGERDGLGSVHFGHRSPRRYAEQEADLGLVEVADPRHDPLVEQGEAEL